MQADERIQTTTESELFIPHYDNRWSIEYPYFSIAVSVIRMIKLFGWERKMEQKISNKRGKEIQWIFRGKVIQMIIDDLK